MKQNNLVTIIVKLFQVIGNLGVSTSNSEDENKRIRIINYSSLIAVFILSIHIIFNLLHTYYLVAFGNLLALSLFAITLYANSKELFEIRNLVFFILFPLGLIPFSFLPGKVGSENFLPVMIVLAFYIFSNKKHKYILSVFYVLIFLFIHLILELDLTLNEYQNGRPFFYWFNISCAAFSLIVLTNVYAEENQMHVKHLNRQNSDLNKQNEFIQKLLKELNHRVKNNLQIVSGLFNLQKYNTDNEQLISALSDAGNRIIAIALLHKALYRENIESTEIKIKDYITELANFLLQSSNLSQNTELQLHIDNLTISIEESIHIGLIINEAMTNSFKHSFVKKQAKQIITIEYYKETEYSVLKISDNGTGFSDNFSPEKANQFGIFLVKTIVENNEGTVKFYNSTGAVVDIKVPHKKYIEDV